jgi:NitT/TauT family transport system ATP-binding protein
MATAEVEVRGLCKSFDGRKGASGPLEVLKDIDFRIHEGEILCLLGPSGCGKTTVLNILAGFQKPTSGEVLVKGRRVDRPGPERGVVFQEHGLFPWRTVLDNVLFGPEMLGRKGEETHALANQYLELIGLRGFEHHYPHQLSGGMQQRVSIARVLVNRPDILLMDEPFGKLDAQTRGTMQVLLLDVWDKLRPTILFITHDIDEAIFLGDRIFVMSCHPGTIVKEIDVGLPRPREYDIVTSLEYLEIKKTIFQTLKGMSTYGCTAGPEVER